MRAFSVFLLFAATACNPYSQRSGEFIAGAVDPVNFPPAYVGTGGDRTRPGRGTFTELRAYAHGGPIGYFSFPFSTTQLPATAAAAAMVDPLRVIDRGKPYAKVPTPTAYLFDPSTPCSAPPGYVYDQRRDDVPLDQQGAIFTGLPTATINPGALPLWSYVPIVAETVVQAPSLPCQAIKSEETLKANAVAGGGPDGKFLAWPIIDGDAPVYRVGETSATSSGWGVQKLGWYNHYIVAYLDGGYVPTTLSDDGSGIVMVTQQLFYPRSMVTKGTSTFPGGLGFGYDVVEAVPGDANYSPVCAVYTYDVGMAVTVDQLPQDVDTIKALYSSTFKGGSPAYVYCLQVP
ncbi:MAG: hypothetical protein JWM53_5526 [bacterium]|nr:hypothetical protein [bacterium]